MRRCSLAWRWRGPRRAAARKGAIRAGCDADFALWDPDEEFVVDAGALFSETYRYIVQAPGVRPRRYEDHRGEIDLLATGSKALASLPSSELTAALLS